MIVRLTNTMKFQKLLIVLNKYFTSDQQLYLMMLQTYRKSMKKPTLEQKSTEMKILQKILVSSQEKGLLSDLKPNIPIKKQTRENEKQIIAYLIQLRNFRLYDAQALACIQKFVISIWPSLEKYEKICCTTALVEQGYYQIFYRFQKQYVNNASNLNDDKKQIVSNVLYRYCKCIVNKKISYERMWENEKQKQEVKKLFQAEFKCWFSQFEYISKIDLILHSQKLLENNQIQLEQEMKNNMNKTKRRSNLQIQIQALLCTLGYSFSREVSIFGYNVDFVVTSKAPQRDKGGQDIKNEKIILEVMGSHHITCEHKIFGKDFIRALILQKFMPLAMVHANDFNVIKGIQNKLYYLQTMIESKLRNKKNLQRNQYKDWNPSTRENQEEMEIKMNEYKEYSKKFAQKLQFDLKKKNNY